MKSNEKNPNLSQFFTVGTRNGKNKKKNLPQVNITEPWQASVLRGSTTFAVFVYGKRSGKIAS